MFANFDFDVIQRTWYYLFTVGLAFTVKLTLISMAGGIVLGTLLAMMRLSSNKYISFIATAYVNLMRSVPLLLVIFWFYFLVPYIGAWVIGANEPIQVGALFSCLITFVMFEAAYYCEIMRSGIQSIPRGQVSAGYALGMNYWQTMGNVVLPQAFRNMIPVLLTQTIVLFQDVSLVSVLSITDFFGAAVKIAQRDNRLVEMYLFVAVVYFILCFSLSSLVKKLQQKVAIIR
ncbi:amino acid ABC transporter permease [Undibacterium sp. TJN25]|uniref:amino acid ABC transporter permease n=1 Tax=Undibacterium sp. TJN25 TaxID=3413056 RepID=UPI003BF25441